MAIPSLAPQTQCALHVTCRSEIAPVEEVWEETRKLDISCDLYREEEEKSTEIVSSSFPRPFPSPCPLAACAFPVHF